MAANRRQEASFLFSLYRNETRKHNMQHASQIIKGAPGCPKLLREILAGRNITEMFTVAARLHTNPRNSPLASPSRPSRFFAGCLESTMANLAWLPHPLSRLSPTDPRRIAAALCFPKRFAVSVHGNRHLNRGRIVGKALSRGARGDEAHKTFLSVLEPMKHKINVNPQWTSSIRRSTGQGKNSNPAQHPEVFCFRPPRHIYERRQSFLDSAFRLEFR